MATMSGGVVERANTIEENRRVLSELLRKNEFVEPSHKELNKLFTRLNAKNAGEIVKDMKCYEPAWHSKKVTGRLYGPIPGIPCGSWWGIRMDCSRDRMHDPFSASVQCGPVGAVSICTSHSNEDVDLGNVLTFTGQSYDDEDKYMGRLVEDAEQDQASKSLVLNFQNQVPVRIIRSYNLSNEYSPKTGYRYDGLYMVADYWIGVSPQNGTRCYKFALKRLFHQEPPPWRLKIPRDCANPLPVPKQDSKNCNLLGLGGITSRSNSASVNTKDTIISRCVSTKMLYTRDGKLPNVTKSAHKRRPIRPYECSSEFAVVPSTSSAQGPTTTILQCSPSRKIVSTDHRNVHVSAIVTRHVSKKLSDTKLLPDCEVNKLWNIGRGSESQVLGSEREEEGMKSQNTRLQNTNISIRTDLYDSSHNLKQHVKKSGSSSTHGPGNFKPRTLGVPRRELNFAGVDSSPGSSRTISSVKMERVTSIDTQLNKKNPNHILSREKKKALNIMTDVLLKTAQSTIMNADTPVHENQTIRNMDIVTSPTVSKTFSSSINDKCIKDKDLTDFGNLETRCLHRIEHSYASQFPDLIIRKENHRNLVSQTTKCKENTEETKEMDSGNQKDEEETTESWGSEVAGSSGSPVAEPELEQTEEESLNKSSPVVSSASQSPLFRGFKSPERSKIGTGGSWCESSIIMNSLTFEKMLDIITEEKSSPIAKMLISKVIGFPTVESSPDFHVAAKTATQIQRLESKASCEIEKRPSSMRTHSSGQQVAEKPCNTKLCATQIDRQNLEKLNSRHSRRFENSKEQKVIEIVYAGREPDDTEGSAATSCNSHTAEDQLNILPRKCEDALMSETASELYTTAKARESTKICDRGNKNLVTVRQYKSTESHGDNYSITRYKNDDEFQDTVKDKDMFFQIRNDPESDAALSPPERRARVSKPEDTVDFCSSKQAEDVNEHCDNDKSTERERPRLTITRGKNNWKQRDLPSKNKLLNLNLPSLPRAKSSASRIINETPKSQPPSIAQIITRSKCLQNLETTNQQGEANRTINIAGNVDPDWKQSMKNPDSKHNSVTTLELRATGRMQQSESEVGDKVTKNIPLGSKGANFQTDAPNLIDHTSKSEEDDRLSKERPSEKMRLIKRSRVPVKRKMEIANLFIDMNMSPQSQITRSKSRSKRSLQGANHLRKSSCPTIVDRTIKRRNDNPVKHPTSPLKRLRKSVQAKSSSVQISNAVTQKKGLSLRNRTKNRPFPSSNINNNNNNNNNSVKRTGKVDKVISKLKNPIKESTQSSVAKQNTLNRLMAAAEIPKRHEAAARTRSGRNPRSLTVGRFGLRRALLPVTDTYGRKKKKKKEKQKQKQTAENVNKQKPIPAKQPPPLPNAKLEFNIYNGNRESKKPDMVSVMTQCSLIPVPPPLSASLGTPYHAQANNETNLSGNNAGDLLHGSDSGSECICSSHNSGADQIKHEVIELIEIKSETVDDDVESFEEASNEAEETRVQSKSHSAFNPASIHLKDRQINQPLDGTSKNSTPRLRRLSKSLSFFRNQESGDSVPKRGFIPYIAGRRYSAFAPVKSVESNLRMAQLKSIGFKPIKPGLFPPDGFEDRSEYGRRSTSDSPRIAYSSAVVKRGVHEEYDKYTSEENNVVQYMDSKLCYEDIENEDFICGSFNEPSFSNVFVQEMKFDKLGNEMEEESNDNSLFRGGDEDEDEEDETEELEKEDVKEWQSQLDGSSSSSEDNEQAVVDSDGDVPWHGWKKIISNKQTYFVGW